MPGGGQKRGRLVGARAAAGKSSLLRYTIRWQEIAMLHRVLEAGSNRRPAGETLDRVGRALKGEIPFVLCSICAVVVCFYRLTYGAVLVRSNDVRYFSLDKSLKFMAKQEVSP